MFREVETMLRKLAVQCAGRRGPLPLPFSSVAITIVDENNWSPPRSLANEFLVGWKLEARKNKARRPHNYRLFVAPIPTDGVSKAGLSAASTVLPLAGKSTVCHCQHQQSGRSSWERSAIAFEGILRCSCTKTTVRIGPISRSVSHSVSQSGLSISRSLICYFPTYCLTSILLASFFPYLLSSLIFSFLSSFFSSFI